MLILYSKLIESPVAELRNQSKIGKISDLIINSENLSIAGAIVEVSHFLFSEKKVVNAVDIVQFLKDGIIIKEAEALTDLAETVRLKKMYEEKQFGVSQKVVTGSGDYVGHVFDYMIDSTTATIRKFHIRKVLSEVLIPASAVISLEGKVLTIKEDKGYSFARPVVETAITN